MSKPFTLAVAIALLPVAAGADTIAAASSKAGSTPWAIVNIQTGVTAKPTYFGSDSYEPGARFALGVEFLRLPWGQTFGSTDPNRRRDGFHPRGSLRLIQERTAEENRELTGLRDVDLAVEIGLGLGYRQRNFEAFVDLRNGVAGHHAWVAELGADYVMQPDDRWQVSMGPRVFLADDDYAATYFGVTPAESLASSLPAFAPSGGALAAGLELEVTYAINPRWDVSGTVRYDRLLGDAEDSPITRQGSADQFSLRIGLSRRVVLDF